MGKGDIKTKRGKIWKGTYGNTRKRKAAPKTEVAVKTETKKRTTKKSKAIVA